MNPHSSRRVAQRPGAGLRPGRWALSAILPVCVALHAGASSPAVQKKTMVLASGATLRYTLALPPSFAPGQRYPLILALHYGGTVTPFYGSDFLTNLVLPVFEGLKAVIVAPDCPGAGWTDPASEAAVLALLGQAQKDYPIDNRRLLVTGYSLGAIGTWDLVFKHPHLFAAAIPISGMPPKDVAVCPTSTRFWVLHSRDDEIFPLKPVREFVRFCRTRGVSVEIKVAAGLSHYQFDAFTPALRMAVPWVRKLWK